MSKNHKIETVKLTKSGVKLREGNKRKIVAPRIQVVAIGTRSHNETFVVQFRFNDINGKPRRLVEDRSILISPKKKELISLLMNHGYEWPLDKQIGEKLWLALASAKPTERFRYVQAPGWYDDVFVTKNRCYRPEEGKKILIDQDANIHGGDFNIIGNLSEWQRGVANHAALSSPLCVSIAAAFAAPLLRSLGIDSFGINWFGDSSTGKSTIVKVATSVPGLFGGGGSIPTWADTEAGSEDQMMGHRDCILPLDETGDGDGSKTKSLHERARSLAFAISRNRPRQKSKAYDKANNLDQRDSYVIVLSSSERALTALARAAGTPRLEGEEVRLIDVPVTTSTSIGIFDGPLRGETAEERGASAKALIEDIAASIRQHQGHAFHGFMKRLVRDKHWRRRVEKDMEKFERKVGLPHAKPTVGRIKRNFAILWAGASLAIHYEVVPWKRKMAFKAIKTCFDRAIEHIEAEAAPPLVSNQVNILDRLSEKLNASTLVTISPGGGVTSEEAAERSKADGFIINGATFIKNDRMKFWFSQKDRSALNQAGAFDRLRSNAITVEKKISGILGKPRYYKIKLTRDQPKNGCQQLSAK